MSEVQMKSFIIGLVICFGILLSTGCKNPDLNVDVINPEGLEIEFWYGLTGVQGEAMEAFIAEYNTMQKTHIIKGVSFDSYDVTAKALEAALARGKGPGVVLLEDYQMYSFAKKGGLRSLDSFIDQRPNFDLKDIYPKFLAQVTIDDKIFGLPIYGTTQILYYRKDLFKQAGLSEADLKTWESLADAAKRLTVTGQDEILVYGWEPMQGRENLIDATINRGGRILSEDGTKVLINEEPWIYTWEQFRKWIHDDQIMKVHYGGEGWQYWYATIDDVLQGRAAGYTGSAGDARELDFNIIGAQMQPYWEGFEGQPVGVHNAHTICIPTFTKDEIAMAAFEWIEYFTSKEITGKWSMETGYLPIRMSVIDNSEFRSYMEKNEHLKVAMDQMKKTTSITYDPTGGSIYEALRIAAEKVEILNIPTQIALDEAQNLAQQALDEYLIRGAQ
jgi:multiple sugar transport system substrate-binding protein